MSRSLPIISTCTALALAACVDNSADTGLTILRNAASDTDCVPSPDVTTFRNAGLIEADSSSGYVFTPLIRNELVAGTDGTSARSVFLRGARITIDFYDEGLFDDAEQADLRERGVTRFMVPLSGSIDAGGGEITLGFEIVPTELLFEIGARLPEPTAADPSPSSVVDVGVQLFGSANGDSIDSNTFHYPVEICDDCLTVVTPTTCEMLPTDFEGSAGGLCNPVQDGTLTCCVTDGGALICPAEPRTPPET